MTRPVKIWHEADGRLLRLRLNRPKANLVDATMIAELDQALEHLGNGQLGAALIDAEGRISVSAPASKNICQVDAPLCWRGCIAWSCAWSSCRCRC